MIKEYKDERINKLIKISFERAIQDSEWSYRYLSEWNLLFECIDKILEFVDSGMTKEIYVNRNMWYILQDTFFDICDLYGVDIKAKKMVREKELLIKKRQKKEISQYLRTYLENICNYLNNIKGYIDKEEIKFLLECIDDRYYHITNEMVEKLSDMVENNECEDFVEELLKIESECE